MKTARAIIKAPAVAEPRDAAFEELYAKMVANGKKPGAMQRALDDCFEQLGENEQEAILAEPR